MAPFLYDDGYHMPSTGGQARHSTHDDKTLPIAIVGMSCRFPGGATDVEKLWKMCAESRDAWSSIPEDRFNLNGYYHPDSSRAGATYVRGGHFLAENPARFDAPFFNITREEAASMDPQQRLLLECSYEALENAGIPMRQVVGSDTSVFMGSFCRDWTDILNRDIEALPFYQATGTGQALLANRLSYYYDLKGPSISIDTACSSSLVALHLACQSLRIGESKQAIVGGSNVILSHETMISMSRMRFLSPDGRCYTYDHRANGYSRGEGAACIVLKPLAEALKHGDTIRGVIRNTGTNQDGRTNGITLPSSEAQEALMRKVYEAAGLDPMQTSYVEAHGTGTPAGDPLEASALSKVFGAGRSSSQPLVVGSIKTNIGHLEGASGLAGLIKTVLMLENNTILPNLNFEKANACIPLDKWNLKIPTNVQCWPSNGIRRASVCNYGYGGSNAHVIIDDASGYLAARGLKGSYRTISSTSTSLSQVPYADTSFSEDKQARVYVLSAFDEASGKLQAKRLASYVSERQSVTSSEFLDDLVFTLAERRSILPYKAAVSASSMSQLIETLSGDKIKYSKATKTPSLGFVFTGQGAQWHAMGRELIAAYPLFRRSLENSSKYLKTFGVSWSLLDELSKTAQESQLSSGYLSQPICTAVQVALVDLLASWGINPRSVTGHSSGEIAAAYAAGALSHQAALAIAYYRGLAGPAIKQLYPRRKGSMLAVGLSREQTQSLISELTDGKVVIACINSPSSVTVSGDDAAIEELLEILLNRKIFARKLNVELAYHSHHMDCIANDYLAALSRIQIGSFKKAEFYSSVTGQRMDFCELGPSYWVTNMLSPVEFSDSLRTMCLDTGDERRERGSKFAVDILIELGPHSALAGPIKQVLQADIELHNSSIRYHTVLVRNKCAVETSLELASQLFKAGCVVNMDAVNNPTRKFGHRVLVDLPPYIWNHSNIYHAESRDSRAYRSRSCPRSDILGALVRNPIPLKPRWRNYIRPAEIPWVRDHRIQADMVYPAGGFIAMAIEAASQHAMQSGIEVSGYNLRNISIGHALVIPEGEVETMFCLQPSSRYGKSPLDTWHDFSVYSVTGAENWTEHCRGSISVQKQIPLNDIDGQRLSDSRKSFHAKLIADAETTCCTDVDISKLYDDLKGAGLHYGQTFAILNHARAAPHQSIGKIILYDTAAVMPSNFQYPFVVHPGTLDGCIQVLFPGVIEAEGQIHDAIMPTHIEEMFVSSEISRNPGHEFKVYAKSEKTSVRQSVSSILVFNNDKADLEPMITFTGLTCSSLPKACAEEASSEAKRLCFKTQWAPSPDYLSSQQIRELSQSETSAGEHPHMTAYIDCLAYKNPHLKCLEINAGTGDVSHSVLQVLRGPASGVPRFSSYDITDVTTEIFEDIKTSLVGCDNLISCRKLNIENDPLEQGFEPASYDLIITSYMAKGRHPMGKTMGSIRKLLKPEGQLVVLGAFQDTDMPVNSEPEWDCVLHLDGHSDCCESAMVVLKPVYKSAPRDFEVVIIADNMTQTALLSSLQASLNDSGATISVTTLSGAEPQGNTCIILSELAQNILRNPSSAEFESIKRVLAESSGVLWVTRGGMIESASPDSNLIAGLARTVRLESSSKIVSLDLDMQRPLDVEKCAQTIAKVFWTNFNLDFKGEIRDVEYAERNGVVMIPRVVEERSLNEYVSATTAEPMPENEPYLQSGRYLTLDFGIPGDLSSLRYIDDIRMRDKLAEDLVEIEVKASGLNPADVINATGRGKPNCLGRECSGIVSAIGKAVSTLKVGDRVVCHAQGTISTSIRQRASCIQLLPDGISFELGASLPVAYTTAYYTLFQVANLERDDTVLVNAASGPLGQAVIRFCQTSGCEVFATVQSSDEKNLLREEFKISQSHIFSSKSGAFVKEVKTMTRGEGVNLIINLDLGEAFSYISDCIAPFGRIVNLNLSSSTIAHMGKYSKNTTVAAVDFDELLIERPKHVMKAFSKAMSLISEGKISLPNRFSTFGMSEIPIALRTMQADKNIGSLVVVPQPDEMVQVIHQDTSQSLLGAGSSYLLVGGLGGLGRAIAMWMVNHGARNLIFASRSGLIKKSARLLVKDLEQKGAKIAVYNCDISNAQQLDDLLTQSVETMPPIRGVIQAAMVIKNSFFQNMTLDDYNASIQPKVQGTWNLHNRLPKNLDFFILLSSAVGTIGNASQAAYAAASTFQDAFASYRACLGLPAISLDLGMIKDIGYVAENHSVQQGLEKLGFEGVQEPELMAMLQSAITNPFRTPQCANIISGLGTYREGDLRPAFTDPRFSHFRRMGKHLARLNGTASTGSVTDDFHDSLRQAVSIEEAAEKICEAIMEKMASLLMIPTEDISANKPMADYGMDSLVAVQMRAWLTVAADAAVSLLELMANMEIRALAAMVARRSKLVRKSV